MFTGIVTDVGTVLGVQQKGDLRARLGTSYRAATIDIGASIACDGVCLTVIDRGTDDDGDWFDVDISAETVSATNIGAQWVKGHQVNLERSLRVGDELGGHIVSGHVDGVAKVLSIKPEGDSRRFVFEAPEEFARFIAPKGSIALNGTSLTVNEVNGAEFGVNIIPHTFSVTTWSAIEVGQKINLEIDTMARYVARLNDYS